jgi:hypothetical protein
MCALSLDHLVGRDLQGERNGQAKRSGSFEINYELTAKAASMLES